MAIQESFELTLGPATPTSSQQTKSKKETIDSRIENPALDTLPGSLGSLICLVPARLNLLDKPVLILLLLFIQLGPNIAEIALELCSIPSLVVIDDPRPPVVLHDLLQIIAVRGFRVGDIVIAKPAFELCFMPFVVGYSLTPQYTIPPRT